MWEGMSMDINTPILDYAGVRLYWDGKGRAIVSIDGKRATYDNIYIALNIATEAINFKYRKRIRRLQGKE